MSLIEAKSHLRVTHSDEDARIAALATAVREAFEAQTRRQLVETTWTLTLDRFPPSDRAAILVPRPPLRSVESIRYIDTAGVEQTWPEGEYTVQAPAGPKPPRGRIHPQHEETYPDTADVSGAVTIEFEAGYAGGAVPEAVKAVLLAALSSLYVHREDQITGTIVSDNRTVRRLFDAWTLPVYA
ncbi:MAG: head-tail connector protein [Gemmatimonadota bacterium]